MRVQADPECFRRTKWHEYLVRFVFGGLITVIAGLIAKRFGPAVGGLFLAFPAIFPASVTLVEKHERDKEREGGHDGQARGIDASGVEAAGAAIGSIGLIAFGAIVWALAPTMPAWTVLTLAGVAWLAASTAGWVIRQKV